MQQHSTSAATRGKGTEKSPELSEKGSCLSVGSALEMESLALLADALSLTIASPFLALSTTVNIEHEHEASIDDSIASAPPRPPTSSFSKRAALLVGALLIFISTVAPATL